ncbi:MAG: D-amino-acid transaminase [Candidatus Pacebacteria bacterium]|nr:D-amino-acid transaminase [Candidatus Paceibacterota bacterium]
MPRIAFVNGTYVPHHQAAVHVEDRGYQFADGVYEVVLVRKNKMLDMDRHLDRLERSLSLLEIPMPCHRRALEQIADRLRRQNLLSYGLIYIQVTRGVTLRDHAPPADLVAAMQPALVMTTKRLAVPDEAKVAQGVSIITLPDERWARCEIKTVGLLPNALAKFKARDAGAFEAWMIDREGFVTEATASNAWIVTKAGKIVTRQLGPDILAGVTRAVVLQNLGGKWQFEERKFSRDEALDAAEAFITSASSFVMPVVKIDGQTIGDGKAGSVALTLRKHYLDAADAA